MDALLNDEVAKLLQFRRLPARLNAIQVGALLGFHPVDLPVLIERKLLRPLGKPARNAVKYFASRDIEALAVDSTWLGKATQVMYNHWQERNERLGRRTPTGRSADAMRS